MYKICQIKPQPLHGLCHVLLGIERLGDLLGHPVVGDSWKGFVIENIINTLPKPASYGFYRTAGGAEMDFVINLGNEALWAIEIKRSTVPNISKGFYSACEDLKPTKKIVVHGGDDSFLLSKEVDALSVVALLSELEAVRA